MINVMLSVQRKNVEMLSGVMMNIITPNVMAPTEIHLNAKPVWAAFLVANLNASAAILRCNDRIAKLDV
jgi:hypothetical protein